MAEVTPAASSPTTLKQYRRIDSPSPRHATPQTVGGCHGGSSLPKCLNIQVLAARASEGVTRWAYLKASLSAASEACSPNYNRWHPAGEPITSYIFPTKTPENVTHMLAPSKANLKGLCCKLYVPTTVPAAPLGLLLAVILVTLPLPRLPTQM